MSVVAKRILSIIHIVCTVTTLVVLSNDASARDPVQSDDCGCAPPSCGCGGCHAAHEGGVFGDHAGACSMPPHYMYYPESHGHYYFRPYNYRTILRHQDSVGRYGGDRRHPYDNRLFQSLYEEVDGAVQEELEVPNPASAAHNVRRQSQSTTIPHRDATAPPKVHVELNNSEFAATTANNSSTGKLRFVSEAK
jgi:hypothetical protein